MRQLKKQHNVINPLALEVRRLCETYGIRPAKNKGQHFLIDRQVLDAIVATADIASSETIVEIGPGLGVLTAELASRAQRVVALELDESLVAMLRAHYAGQQHVTIVHGNALRFVPAQYVITRYAIVANLPYNITAHFFKTFLTMPLRPTRMVVLVQKEVAQRICAKPGEHSLLSLSVQLYAEPRYIQTVAKESFWPQPNVSSAILAVDNIKSDEAIKQWLGDIPEKFFWQIVRIGFASRRKLLAHNISAGLRIDRNAVNSAFLENNFGSHVRAQELGLDQWLLVAKKLIIFSNSKP